MAALQELLDRGGPVVWPLLALSVLSLTLVIERAIFYSSAGRRSWRRHAEAAAASLRAGDAAAARTAVEGDAGVLAPVVRAAAEGPAAAEAEARAQAARVERVLPWLGVVVSAAPMLGILGTVLGIIASFDALSTPTAGAAPRRPPGRRWRHRRGAPVHRDGPGGHALDAAGVGLAPRPGRPPAGRSRRRGRVGHRGRRSRVRISRRPRAPGARSGSGRAGRRGRPASRGPGRARSRSRSRAGRSCGPAR